VWGVGSLISALSVCPTTPVHSVREEVETGCPGREKRKVGQFIETVVSRVCVYHISIAVVISIIFIRLVVEGHAHNRSAFL